MSSTPPGSGRTTVFAYAIAKEGKADELQKLLAEARKSAESDKEPYTITYRTNRHGNTFAMFEEYDQDVADAQGNKGIEAHKLCPPFQNLVKSGLVESIDIKFYNEFSS
ncbi:uncharacterized protein JCM15063_002827 [Sporobolomyces koalae]|uniref:uncharacterized protein n=1 Tax=Sporobolomyces koalae TaxID=500713 RepID=UPI003178D842